MKNKRNNVNKRVILQLLSSYYLLLNVFVRNKIYERLPPAKIVVCYIKAISFHIMNHFGMKGGDEHNLENQKKQSIYNNI